MREQHSTAMQLMITKTIGMNSDVLNGHQMILNHNSVPIYGKYGNMRFSSIPASMSPRLHLRTDHHRPRRRRSNHSLVATMDPIAVARRNERERNRVKQVNDGFDALRKKVPFLPDKKKLSKVEILRCAMMYINDLKCVVEEFDHNNSHLLPANVQHHQCRAEGSVSSLSNNSTGSDDDCILLGPEEDCLVDLDEELLEC